MPETGKKRDLFASGLNLQNIMIFVIIIVTFTGSALLFWSFNTSTLRSSIEAETILSSSLLADDIAASIPKDAVLSGSADYKLSNELSMIEENIENENDVWLIDAEGKVYYKNGASEEGYVPGEKDSKYLQTIQEDSVTEEALDRGMAVRWMGRKGMFLLHQECCVVRPVYEGSMFLVIINHANSAQAVQRQQFTLFMAIDILLMLVMLVLVINNFAKSRRQLIRFATTDELTDLANRKNFNETFAEFVEENKNKDFSLFLLDIDFFKQINDNYSHAAGDHALKYLAGEIRAMTKKEGGFAGRWGGDEFIGVLPCKGEQALEILQGLCRKVEAARMEEGFTMTISAGLVFADKETNLVRLSENADMALYESKEKGRNRASLYRQGKDVSVGEPAETGDLTEVTGMPDEGTREEDSRSFAAFAETISDTFNATISGGDPDQKAVRENLKKRLAGYVRDKLIDSTILGVRWMAPFVAGGGILIALAFLFDAASVNLSAMTVTQRASFGSITVQAATLKNIGGITFNFMLPVFAGFMAYGIAGEEAFMTGFVGGYMSIDSNAGFIGAMIAGFTAGIITNEGRQFIGRLPWIVKKAAPILIFPVINLLLMQVISFVIITPISSAIGKLFTGLLEILTRTSNVATGTLSAMMMAVDMGGIVNKVAYNYGVRCIPLGHTDIMASVMIGGMVPPLGIALSTFFYRNKYTPKERESGIGALFMGLSFITEGALPFVFTDIFRVIPSCMLGSALAGLLSELFGCRLPAPHGGLFVIPVIEHPLLYIIALCAGSLVTAVTLGTWKKDKQEPPHKP